VDDRALLDLWARAGCRAGGDRAEVLAEAWSHAGLALGERNRVLLAACPERIDCAEDCPDCGERMDYDLRPAELLAAAGPAPATVTVALAGRSVGARAPRAEDMEAAAACATVAEARAVLAERCAGAGLDEAGMAAVGEALDAADPLLAPEIAVTCPACGSARRLLVDPAALVWHAVEAGARSLAAEVADLARAFGWSEADVLALPASRRRLYLELAG
jgi:hypothetical protein